VHGTGEQCKLCSCSRTELDGKMEGKVVANMEDGDGTG
jgi:hypothetical protein